jgi:hypothetical protein
MAETVTTVDLYKYETILEKCEPTGAWADQIAQAYTDFQVEKDIANLTTALETETTHDKLLLTYFTLIAMFQYLTKNEEDLFWTKANFYRDKFNSTWANAQRFINSDGSLPDEVFSFDLVR